MTATLSPPDSLACLSLAEDLAGVEARALLALEPRAEDEAASVPSGVSGLTGILGRLGLKSRSESFQLTEAGLAWLRLALAAVVDLSLMKEVFVDLFKIDLLNLDFDLALASSSSSSSEPSLGSPEILKLAEEDVNRILSTLSASVGFFLVAADFILLTNLGLSMEGLGNFFTDLRALMTKPREREEMKKQEVRFECYQTPQDKFKLNLPDM